MEFSIELYWNSISCFILIILSENIFRFCSFLFISWRYFRLNLSVRNNSSIVKLGEKIFKPVWSTLIGRGMSRLGSHWSRDVATPALLSHKEPARRIQSPIGGYFACSSLVLYDIKELEEHLYEALNQWEPSLDIPRPMRVDHTGVYQFHVSLYLCPGWRPDMFCDSKRSSVRLDPGIIFRRSLNDYQIFFLSSP